MKLGRKINNIEFEAQNKSNRIIVWLVSFIIISFLAWSAMAPLDTVVRGIGRIAPATQNQIIQNLEGGIVREIFVTEGDVVEAGQVVAEMDSTRFQSAYQELRDQYLALSLRLLRLEAERNFEAEFSVSNELLEAAPEHAASERQLFISRRSQFSESLNNLIDLIALKEEEVGSLQAMAELSAIPPIELNRAEQNLIESRARLAELRNEFEATRAQEYSEVLISLRQIEEQMRSREDQLSRTSVRTPIRGIVNEVITTTIGGVVQPGDPLLEILSLEDNLRIEGRISPSDIGFVYVGMPATIKLTAFDFSVYGTLEGTVVHVGADTVTDPQQRDPVAYYEVFIDLLTTTLEGPDGEVFVRAGMQAQIELVSGQRTVLQYILSPLFKTSEALTEI